VNPMNLIRLILALGLVALPALSQAITLHGQVTDETGAVIPEAIVTLTGPDGVPRAAVATKEGSYSFNNLPAGNDTVNASSPGLALRQRPQVSAKAGSQTLNLSLNVVAEKAAGDG